MSNEHTYLGMNFFNPLAPAPVRKASTLLYIALGLGFLSDVIETAVKEFESKGSGHIYLILAFSAVLLWIYGCVANGRNWARIITSIFILPLTASVIDDVASFAGAGAGRQFVAVLDTSTLALHAYALFLVWSNPGRDWFGNKSATDSSDDG